MDRTLCGSLDPSRFLETSAGTHEYRQQKRDHDYRSGGPDGRSPPIRFGIEVVKEREQKWADSSPTLRTPNAFRRIAEPEDPLRDFSRVI
jgi:hypothetical protein